MEKLEAAIEAILFSAGDSVETGRIAKAIGQDKTTTEKIIRNMMLKYNARDRGIKILELDGAFQLCTKQEYYEYLVEIALQKNETENRPMFSMNTLAKIQKNGTPYRNVLQTKHCR